MSDQNPTQEVPLTPPETFDGSSIYITEAKDIYLDIAKLFPTEAGKAISKKEREELNLKQTTLVYGEISFDSFGSLFIILWYILMIIFSYLNSDSIWKNKKEVW